MEESQNTTQTRPEQLTLRLREQQEDEIDLVELFYLLWGHMLQIIACVIVGGAVTFAYTYFLVTPQYQATAKMYVVSSSSLLNVNNLSISSELAIDYQELIRSRPLLENVIEELDVNLTASQLSAMITINNPTDTRILSVTVTNPDPQLAADLANEISQQAIIFLEKVMEAPPPNVYEDAIVPAGKFSPSYSRNTLLGAIALAVVYCGILILRYMMDDSFTTPEEISRCFGVQPLAVIPEGNFGPGYSRHKHARGQTKKLSKTAKV